MTVMAYEIHSDVATHHDVFEKLKDFAVTQGWTLNLYHKNNVQWSHSGGGVYAFNAGTESYLELESNGYGNQTLQFRIRVENSLTDSLNEYVRIGPFNALTNTRNVNSSQHPTLTSTGGAPWMLTSTQAYSYKPTDISKIWIAGNDKFLILVSQFSSDYYSIIMFGSLEVEDPTTTQGNFLCFESTSTSSSFKWYNTGGTLGLDQGTGHVMYDNDDNPFRSSLQWSQNSGTANPTGGAYRYARAIAANTWTVNRPQRKAEYLLQRDSDSLFFYMGKCPVFRMDVSNIEPGSLITYSTEKYIVFPAIHRDRHKGISIRVA